MPTFRADWLLPIGSRPIANGSVTIEGGRIAAISSGSSSSHLDLGRAAILPGLVNAHTHLELSYLHGTVPRAGRFIDWVGRLMAARREYADPDDSTMLSAAERAIAAARRAGTALVGDVSNTLATVPLLRRNAVAGRVFLELLGFNAPDPDARVREARARVRAVDADAGGVRVSLAPHAPYSVSPGLFRALRADLDAQRDDVSTVHCAESPEEVQLLKDGSGPWRAMLQDLGAWNPAWVPPARSPVEYLNELGFLDRRVLIVHGVQCGGEDLRLIRARGARLISCPRSNQYVGVGAPPLEAFYAARVEVALGTDSLASVDDLNLFAELAECRRLTPRVSARALLESATLTGARALGFDAEFGSIEVGKRAALIAVRVPQNIGDVEEYLVGGVSPRDITWLEEL